MCALERSPYDADKALFSSMGVDTRQASAGVNSVGMSGTTKTVDSYQKTTKKEDKKAKAEELVAVSQQELPQTEEEEISANLKQELGETDKSQNDKALTPRQERKDAWSRAHEQSRKAAEESKLAKQELAKAKQLQEFLQQAKQDPTILAQALGMSKDELYRTYTNKYYDLKDEVKADVQQSKESVENRVDRLEKEKAEMLQQQQQAQYQENINKYKADIASKLVDPDKFEMIHLNGKSEMTNFIYDIMNAQYQEDGTILDPVEVAEAVEEKLLQKSKNNIEVYKKSKKLSGFVPDVETKGAAQLGAKKTISGNLRPAGLERLTAASPSILQRKNELKEDHAEKRRRVLANLISKGQ